MLLCYIHIAYRIYVICASINAVPGFCTGKHIYIICTHSMQWTNRTGNGIGICNWIEFTRQRYLHKCIHTQCWNVVADFLVFRLICDYLWSMHVCVCHKRFTGFYWQRWMCDAVSMSYWCVYIKRVGKYVMLYAVHWRNMQCTTIFFLVNSYAHIGKHSLSFEVFSAVSIIIPS